MLNYNGNTLDIITSSTTVSNSLPTPPSLNLSSPNVNKNYLNLPQTNQYPSVFNSSSDNIGDTTIKIQYRTGTKRNPLLIKIPITDSFFTNFVNKQ